ncbi:hypothetical protein COCCU_13080 [Corynebacterium occultum]|uniref:DUF3054 domain-containing protein n=1 Tax=Corynebacterium occultum TaxID=2675219 RepID=A0A6B8WB49_9CORY|nr:hypothetical protein COCCU_13080 [Corynebacterium occultum]
MNKPAVPVMLDVLAIALFALLARMAHQSEDMPLNFNGWLSTLWPFLIGVALSWVLILVLKWEGRLLVPAGVSAWVITVLTGLVIWSIRNEGIPHWSFIMVATIMSGVLMLGWRGVAKVSRKVTV